MVLLTEWSDIVNSDWRAIFGRMVPPRFIFDGRNALDPGEMEGLGFEYRAVGRGRFHRKKSVDDLKMDKSEGVDTGVQVGR